MLRLTFTLLLVGLIAVSAQTATKTITLKDVQNDEAVDVLRRLLSLCSMNDPSSQDERKNYENALKEVMKYKNFSAFYDQFLNDITETRKAECPPGSDPNKFTGRNSDNYMVIPFRVISKPEAKPSTENDEEPSAVHKPQCKWPYFEKDGQCYPGFGASCQDDTGCAQKNMTCLQGKCSCNGHYSPLSKICRKWPTELNDFCHEALPCDKMENSYCTGKCVCKTHYFERNGRCVPGLGAPCTQAEECNEVPNLTCVARKCAFL